MRYLAFEGAIMSLPDVPKNHIEITEEQYAEALAGMQAGKRVTIKGGFALVDPEPEEQQGNQL